MQIFSQNLVSLYGREEVKCARSKFRSVKIQLIFQIWCKFLINMLESSIHVAIERFIYFLKFVGRARLIRVVFALFTGLAL